MLDYGGEPVITVSNFDVACLFKYINSCLVREDGRARTKGQSDLLLPFPEWGLLAAGDTGRLLPLGGVDPTHCEAGNDRDDTDHVRNRKNALCSESLEIRSVFHTSSS